MTSTMSVLYLPTGHVVAAISSRGPERTVKEIAGGEVLRVRVVPNGRVDVPVDLLSLLELDADADVVDGPYRYRVVAGALAGGAPLTSTFQPGAAGAACVTVWQVGDESHASSQVLGSGGLPPASLPGTTHRLVAYANGPLYLGT